MYGYVLVQMGQVPYSITAKIYRENCIRTKLNNFIYKNYSDRSKFDFWSDLTTSHYAKTTLDLLTSLNIHFVKRAENSLNLFQCRLKDNFWSKLKSEACKVRWEAISVGQLKQRIKLIFSKVGVSSVRCNLNLCDLFGSCG